MKRWFLPVMVLLLLTLSVGMASAQAVAADYSVEVDGKPLVLDTAPINIDGRILVPFRAIFEALGGSVEWHDNTKSAIAKNGATTIELVVDSSSAKVNGSSTFLDVPARNMNDRILVPVRFVSENFGSLVVWNQAQGKVSITKVEGTLQIAGSTSVQPLSEELAKAFMAKYPKVKINIAGGGSSAGVKAAQTATADIGAASRELKAEEKPTVKEFVIALDGVAIVVHKNNTVNNLSLDQVKRIFSGEIKNWSEVGGTAGVIRVIGREEGSGTRACFEEIVLGKTPMVATAIIQNSTGAVRTGVSTDANAIGYISLGSLDTSIKALSVDNAAATTANVKNNTYKVWRYFLYLTQKDPVGVTKAYIDFVRSASGQAIVSSHKFITID